MAESFGDPYPRIYRLSKANIIFLLFFSALTIGFSGFAFWSFFIHNNGQSVSMGYPLFVAFLVPLALGVYILATTLTSKVILSQDVIETVGLLSTRRLMRHEIAGRRLIKTRNGTILKIVPQDDTKPTLSLQGIEKDKMLDAWINMLPDLDAKDLQRSKQEVEQDLTLGNTKEERLAKLNGAKKLANALNIAGITIAMIGAVIPLPPEAAVAILAALPLVAITLRVRYPHLYKINNSKNSDVHPNLAMALLVPGFGLLLNACNHFPVLDWHTPAVMALLIACVLCAVVMFAEESKDNKIWLKASLIFVLFIPYGYGVVMGANGIFDDHIDQTTYKVMVLNKHISHGSKSGTHYHLDLSPWAEGRGPRNIEVSYRFYNQLRIGDFVCISVRPGALSMPWYRIMSCGFSTR